MEKRVFIAVLMLVSMFLLSCGGSSGDGVGVGAGRAEYYVDASAGDDANDGRSQALAWRTLAKIESVDLSAGVTVYLKRNEVWSESLVIPGNDFVLDAYGTGAKPLLDGAVPVMISSDIGGGIYAYDAVLAAGEGLGNVKDSLGMMKFVAWQSDVATTLGIAPPGSYTYDYGMNRLFIKPLALNNPYRISKKLIAVRANNLSDIHVRNIAVQGYSLHGIQFNNCTRCSAENISIKNIGGAVLAASPVSPPDYLYAGNGIEFANSSSAGVVDNVDVSDVFDSCLTVQTFESGQLAGDIRFANSRVSRCGFAGVELSVLSNGGAAESRIDGIDLTALSITSAGKGWSGRRYGSEGYGVRIKADKGAGVLSGVSVSQLDVTDSAGDGFFLAGESGTVSMRSISVHRNAGSGIRLADADATGLKLELLTSLIYKNDGYGLSYNAPFAAGLRLVHNTFVDNAGINLAVYSSLSMLEILNNVFYGSASMTHLFFSTAFSSATINYNCYNDYVNMFAYNGLPYSTVVDFNNATAFESNGIGNMPVALAGPAEDNFSLSSISSCRNLGSGGTGITTDYIGNTYQAVPDSGAYTYVN